MKSCRWFQRSALPVMVSAVFLVVSVSALANHVKEISGMGVDWRVGAEPNGPYAHQMIGAAGLSDSSMAVWSEKVGSYYQVFRFADGVGEQITADNNYNLSPQIAENGGIVWAKQKADGSSDICQYDPAATVTLFSDSRHNVDPQVNSKGDVVWQNYTTVPFNNYEIVVDSKIYFEQDSNITVLDNLGYNSSSPQINDSDLIAWIGKGTQSAVLSYYAGETHLLATSNYAISNLRLNNQGQVVWQGSDGQNSEIYFYDISAGGQPQQISSSQDNYNNLNPQINDSGAVVWQQWDGANYDICLYQPSGGPPVNLTHLNVYDEYFKNYSPQINNRGDVAWILETTEAYSNMGKIGYWYIQLYNYIDQTGDRIEFNDYLHMMTDDYLDGTLRLNELCQVMWQADDDLNATDSLYVSTPETYYQFTFYYNKENTTKGDYYKGYFVDEMYAYTQGQTKDVSVVQIIGNETQDVGTGYYKITEVLPDLTNVDYSIYPYGGRYGNVFVVSYYDYQSDTTFTPVDVSGMTPSGIYGFGSEGGEIYEYPLHSHYWEDGLGLPGNKVELYYTNFGVETPSFSTSQNFYEANVLQSRYDFEYHYNSSDDYYSGYVYAPPGAFEVGMQLINLNGKYWEPLEHGYYKIVNQIDGFDVSTAYKFYVTSYYDSLYDSQMNPGQTDILPVNSSLNGVYGAVPSWFGEEQGYAFGRTTSGQFSIDKEADLREKFRFVSFGDSQTSSGEQVWEYILDLGSSVNTWKLSGAVDQILKLDPQPDFTVFLGDMGNWADDLSDDLTTNWLVWRDTVKPLYDYSNNTGIPIYPVAGNHDKYTISVIGDTMLGTLGYSKAEIYFWLAVTPGGVFGGDVGALFTEFMRLLGGILNYQDGVDAASRYSLESQDALTLQRAFVDQFVQEVKPGYALPYYSMEYGNSYFTFLDSHYIDESLIGTDYNDHVFAPAHDYKDYFQEVAGSQLDWLIADVGQTSQFNKFAFAHKPAVSVGGAVDWNLWNFLDSREFDIFYGADEHLYARAFVDNVFLDSLTANNANNSTTHNVIEIVTGGLTDQFTLLDEVHQAWEDAEASSQSKVRTGIYQYVVTDVDSEITRTTAYELVEITRPEPLRDESGGVVYAPVIDYIDEDGQAHYVIDYIDDDGSPHYQMRLVTQEVFDHWASVPFDLTVETKQIPPRNTGGESRYDFTCFYNNGNGDHYSGYLYAPTGYQGYKVGYRQEFTDENGQQGYYEITNQISLGANSGWDGTVYVTSYYDQETGRAFIPMGNDHPVGFSYLGSELDYINSNAEGHRFGWSYWEAEVDSVAYAFTFAYSNSLDQYTGTFYAPVDQYRIGDSRETPFGSYFINGAMLGLSAELENRVTLNQYTLGGGDYIARGGDQDGYFGYAGLGSESGYIISDRVPEYYFSTLQPARLVTYAYDFTYYYNNGSGDSYQGTMYARPEMGYVQDQSLAITADENGQPGSYRITGVRTADAAGNSFSRSLDNQVYVNTYYNSENQKSYDPVGKGTAVGTNYLTSEHDHIILGWVPEYAFGGGFEEADLVTYAYDYTFNFNNGDSYKGIVYAEPEKGYYTPGIGYYATSQPSKVEDTLTGGYSVTNHTTGFDVSLAGKVTMASYYDVEMKRTYIPTFTWGDHYLGSEYGYINITDYPEKYHPATEHPPGINKFLFGNYGGMMYEADVKEDKKKKVEEITYTTQVAMNVTEPLVSYQPEEEGKSKKAK